VVLQEAKTELEALHPQLTSGNFAEFAQKRSDCGSFAKGGDLVRLLARHVLRLGRWLWGGKLCAPREALSAAVVLLIRLSRMASSSGSGRSFSMKPFAADSPRCSQGDFREGEMMQAFWDGTNALQVGSNAVPLRCVVFAPGSQNDHFCRLLTGGHAFVPQVGEISGLIETDSGTHIIHRTA